MFQSSAQSNALLGIPLDSREAQSVEDPTPMHVIANTQPSVSPPSRNKGARPKTGTKQQSEHTTGKKVREEHLKVNFTAYVETILRTEHTNVRCVGSLNAAWNL